MIVDESKDRNCSDEIVYASDGDEHDEIKIERRINEEAFILLHCARFIWIESYYLVTIMDDVGFFLAMISVRSRLKLFL